jgi:hypothetical protein
MPEIDETRNAPRWIVFQEPGSKDWLALQPYLVHAFRAKNQMLFDIQYVWGSGGGGYEVPGPVFAFDNPADAIGSLRDVTLGAPIMVESHSEGEFLFRAVVR